MLRQHHRMPRRPQQLPPELRGHAFTTRSAVEAGVDKKRLRGADLDHPFRGIHVAGIGGFEPNHWVVLSRPAVRYRIDIAFPDAHVGLEYQGEYHHDIDQWRRDMTRLSRLRAEGWTMVELSSHDLRDPGELTFRIRRILRQPRPPRGQFGPE
jgi:hypothetical protein